MFCPQRSSTHSTTCLPPGDSTTQAHTLLDALAFAGCLQRIKETAFAGVSSSAKGTAKVPGGSSRAGGASQATAHDDAGDEGDAPTQGQGDAAARSGPAMSAGDLDIALCLCREALEHLGSAVGRVSLRGRAEVLHAALEGAAELLPCTRTAKAPTGARALGLSSGACDRCCC